jgi:hypothetical protein
LKRKSTFALLAITTLVLLAACSTPPPPTYSLEVYNYCTGPNNYVRFYFDDVYQATIYAAARFTGITRGTHELYAVGTGYGASSARRSVYFDTDYVWVLCPPASSQVEVQSGASMPEQLEPAK